MEAERSTKALINICLFIFVYILCVFNVYYAFVPTRAFVGFNLRGIAAEKTWNFMMFDRHRDGWTVRQVPCVYSRWIIRPH
jgi:hypothetical protein